MPLVCALRTAVRPRQPKPGGPRLRHWGGDGKVTGVTGENDVIMTDDNDYRVTVQLHQAGQAEHALKAVGGHRVETEVQQALGGRVVVGAGASGQLFLYTHSQDAAATAQQSVSDLLTHQGIGADFSVQRWHPVEEEWEPADVPLPQSPAAVKRERERLDAEDTRESLAAKHALFEVRVQVPSHRDSVALADQLKSEGYSVVRRWRFLVVGANNPDQAAEFAAAIHGEAPAGSVITTEEVGGPIAPFTAWEIAADSGL
jgi:hypothetical protein